MLTSNSFKSLIVSLIVAFVSAFGANVSAQSPISIVDHIKAGRVNTVTQPEALTRLLGPAAPKPAEKPAEKVEESGSEEESQHAATSAAVTTAKVLGYRVQVFSDNNPRTAKNEARTKQRSISGRFPNQRTYVTYTSPYWRLKVGDFRSQAEAQEFAEELKRAFPANSKEIRVVRDRVNVTN